MPGPAYFWEDFAVGVTAEIGTKHVTRDEILAFAAEFDPQPFHLDEAAAERSILGGLCASGWHSCAMVMRLMCDGFLLDSASLGGPGIDEVRWQKPVYVDDVLTLHRTCVSARTSASRPEMGLINFHWRLVNQAGDIAMIMRGWQMFRRRHPGAPIEAER
jgi:acyl dehydratase